MPGPDTGLHVFQPGGFEGFLQASHFDSGMTADIDRLQEGSIFNGYTRSSPTSRYIKAFAAWTRGAFNANIQRITSGAMKCEVGRRMSVRRNVPSSSPRSLAASVASCIRNSRGHFAPP